MLRQAYPSPSPIPHPRANPLPSPSKPKTARSARALAAREPLVTENTKTVLLLRYTSASSLLTSLLTDLHSLKRPHAIRFTKKNAIHPFSDASSFEFFALKNDASLLLFASHSKKRPHALTWVRCFGGKVLDMLELLVVPETMRTLAQFKGAKTAVGVKPLLSFSGGGFESPVPNEYTLAKSVFVDFFRGVETREVDVEGMQLLISFMAGEEGEGAGRKVLHMRVYRLVTRRSGQRVPRVEVEEIGPRCDFRIGRVRVAEEGMWKEAMRRGRGVGARARKNVETDVVGDKVGRIHLGRQDLGELQTRKMKGLKRARDNDVEEEEDGGVQINGDVASVSDGEGEAEKRQRIA